MRISDWSSDVALPISNHRIIDLGTGEKPGPTRDAVKQAGIDLGQQARPQPVAPIAPPLPTGRIATATGYLGETRIAIAFIRPRIAWSAGAVTVAVPRRVHEIP